MINPFSPKTPVIPPIFSGRSLELTNLRKSILEDNESVSISGFNGIGKSSLILTLLEDLKANDQGIFPVQIKENQFRDYLTGEFLSLVVREVCIEIWTKSLGGKISELLEQSLLNARATDLESKNKKILKRIFRIVTSESLSSKGLLSSNAGAKLIFEGSITESNEFSIVRKPLISSEFLLLIDELMEILADKGYKKIVIVCDQLNHAAPEMNYEIVSQYFELLSSRNIFFLVSAINRRADGYSSSQMHTEALLKSFGRWIELGCFSDSKEIHEFAKNCTKKANIKHLLISSDFYRGVFGLTEGYPWFVAKLMEYIFEHAAHSKSFKINAGSIERFEKSFIKAISIYKEEDGCVPTSQLESLLCDKYRK